MDSEILIFTDLDGCLLNKADYRYDEALPVLKRLAAAQIPVVLCSSKTRSEMTDLQAELSLSGIPMTCENGGVIIWSDWKTEDSTVLGEDRTKILDILQSLKSDFAFRSFRDLGVDGVMKSTDLPRKKAEAAIDRHSTEPLLWDDDTERVADFREALGASGLTLTEGGRFWHVAATVTKGAAMQQVVNEFTTQNAANVTTIAIGDSPIDQSMLNIADIPIGIPQPTGEWKIDVDADRGIAADFPGPRGWAQAVELAVDRLQS